MKKITLTIISMIFCAITFAQSVPQGINYQAVARDASGVELTNQTLTIQLSVMSGSSTGSVSWQETHSVTTNDFGLFTAVIGGGTSTGGGTSATFDDVDWGSTSHYIKVEMNGVDMGTTQMMSVPYALHAASSSDNHWGQDGSGNIHASNGGNVGIGTSNPIRGKLEIMGNQLCCGTTNGSFNYFLGGSGNTNWNWYNGNQDFNISVYADGRFMGEGIHIFSDERIKDIVGLSNSENDLSTLLSLEITDYKMKDKAKGNKPYKKVIAQQVMSVYPQAVSLTTEVVPDIYQLSTIDNGYVSLETNLKVGEKVRLILEDETSLFDVISVGKNGFKVSTDKSGKVFVYGREVDDFHAVDYESLSMLNVSATQELYRLILSQQQTIESLETEVAEIRTDFDERLKELEGIINTTTLNK